jgi:hypothetical protein
MDKMIRERVWERSKGYCEMCGIPMDKQDFALHHRKLKSRGGKDTMSNLIALHHGCHNTRTDSIHLNPKWATEHGFMVSSWSDPENVALCPPNGSRIILLNDGSIKLLQTEKGEKEWLENH